MTPFFIPCRPVSLLWTVLFEQNSLYFGVMADERTAALQQWKEFLESTPAYVQRRFENLVYDLTPSSQGYTWGFNSPRIQLYCEVDDGVRGFDPSASTVGCAEYNTRFIAYTCRDCGQWGKTFAVVLAPDLAATPRVLVAIKVGEYPPFGSHLAKRLRDMLSKTDLELYRKGLRTEREGHGIGAAAYFRRVVDNQWKALVKKLRDAAEKLGAPRERLKVFDEALAQPQFSTAVDMLKDAIPAKLLILDGRNPLTLLYKPLSVQIHDLSDEQCLQQAADIRVILNETFDNISRVLKDDETLKAAVTRLQGS
jgi:predicted component of type VI protein secretion system